MELIRGWLNLPEGPWPPDHYTLLGLERGTGTAELIETRALERMDLLRRYQLAHPEPVTEAMNRIAQAMLALTDAASRAAYDAELGLAPTPPPPAVAAPAADTPSAVLMSSSMSEQVIPREPSTPSAPSLPPAPAATPVKVEPERPPAVRLALQARHERVVQRGLYQKLAQARQVLRAWDAVGRYVARADETLTRRADSVELAARLDELRKRLTDEAVVIGNNPSQPGHLVVSLARQPLSLQTFRSLLPSQREAMARDWAEGRQVLIDYRNWLRREVTLARKPSLISRRHRRMLLSLLDQPGLSLALLGTLALLIAGGRTLLLR